jgi:hypothetical protein
MVGKGPHTVEENYLNEFCVVVGPTATARKGSSLRSALNHLQHIDPDWKRAVRGCPPSGEGIVWHLRGICVIRELSARRPTQASKRSVRCSTEEFSRIMASIARGGTLSHRLRECWDHRDPLENLTKIDPITATRTRISIIAHCTPHEFKECVRTSEQRNGFMIKAHEKNWESSNKRPKGLFQFFFTNLLSSMRGSS